MPLRDVRESILKNLQTVLQHLKLTSLSTGVLKDRGNESFLVALCL